MKSHERADIAKISKESFGFILHRHLSMRNLSQKRMQLWLSFEQRQQYVDVSKQYLAIFIRSNP